MKDDILKVMKRHTSILAEEICHYFSKLQDFEKYCRFTNNPFGITVGGKFTDLVNDEGAKQFSVKYVAATSRLKWRSPVLVSQKWH